MSTITPSFDHPLLRESRAWPVAPFTAIICALMLLAGLYAGEIGLRHMGWLTQPLPASTDPDRSYDIVIGNVGLEVPASHLRFEEQHRSGLLPRIDLALRWPDMEPLGDPETLRQTPRETIMFVRLQDDPEALDSNDLLRTVYRQVFVGAANRTAAGLVERKLDPEAGYGEDVVYFNDDGSTLFAARCSAPMASAASPSVVLPLCHRDLVLANGLALTYRFAPTLLGDWRALDDGVLNFLIGLSQYADETGG